MHIVSFHGRWKPCLPVGEDKVGRSRYQNGSVRNVESPKRDQNTVSPCHDDEDLSHESTQAATVDLVDKNNTSPESSQKRGSKGRKERSNSCETGGQRSQDSPPSSQSSRRKATRSSSSEGKRTTRSNSHDGVLARTSTNKETGASNQTNQSSSPNKESEVTRGISRSNSNSKPRTESGQAAFLDSSQHHPDSRKASQDLHVSENRADGTNVVSSWVPILDGASASGTSSNRRMPKGSHEALAAPAAQSSQKQSSTISSKKKVVAPKPKKASEISPSSSSTNRTTSAIEHTNKGQHDSEEFDGNASSTSLCASKPASERTDCSYGSLPLKEASKPGDPPAKRPQRYRRVQQQAPKPPARDSQRKSSTEPKVVKTPSNRFLQVAKDASSGLPSVPQRSQSPASTKKKKASIPPPEVTRKEGGEVDTMINPGRTRQQSTSPRPCRSIDEEKTFDSVMSKSSMAKKKGQSTAPRGNSSLSTNISHSACDPHRSRRWDTAPSKSTVPRAPKSIDLEIGKPTIISSFDPTEWDTDEEDTDDDDAAASV